MGADYEESFTNAFARAIASPGCTRIRQVGRMPPYESPHAPSHAVCAFERELVGDWEQIFFVVTVGLGSAPLGSSSEGSLRRVELLTCADQHGPELCDFLSVLGRAVHTMAAAGNAPWFHGELFMLSDGAHLGGFSRFLLARPGFGKVTVEREEIDLLRVVPLSVREHEALGEQSRSSRASWLAERELRCGPELLARWHSRARA